MRILTVRQPWAWAIIHGGKNVENRVRNVDGGYRGPVAIHVGLTYDTAWSSPALYDAMHATDVHRRPGVYPWHAGSGAIIGVVDIASVHHPNDKWGCPTSPGDLLPMCSSWAVAGAHHLVLANPRPLAQPIPFKGALGLRTLDDDTVARIESELQRT